jgi:hypothetical protein
LLAPLLAACLDRYACDGFQRAGDSLAADSMQGRDSVQVGDSWVTVGCFGDDVVTGQILDLIVAGHHDDLASMSAHKVDASGIVPEVAAEHGQDVFFVTGGRGDGGRYHHPV